MKFVHTFINSLMTVKYSSLDIANNTNNYYYYFIGKVFNKVIN